MIWCHFIGWIGKGRTKNRGISVAVSWAKTIFLNKEVYLKETMLKKYLGKNMGNAALK